jgi:hypothetical protein
MAKGFLELLKDFVPAMFLVGVSLICLAAMLIGELQVIIDPEHVTAANIAEMVNGLQIYFAALGGVLLFTALGLVIVGKDTETEDTVTTLVPPEK